MTNQKTKNENLFEQAPNAKLPLYSHTHECHSTKVAVFIVFSWILSPSETKHGWFCVMFYNYILPFYCFELQKKCVDCFHWCQHRRRKMYCKNCGKDVATTRNPDKNVPIGDTERKSDDCMCVCVYTISSKHELLSIEYSRSQTYMHTLYVHAHNNSERNAIAWNCEHICVCL